MERISVRLSDRRYDIVVGHDLMSRVPTLAKSFGSKRAFLLVDTRLKSVATKLERGLRGAGWQTSRAELPASESTKDFRKMFEIYSRLIESGMDRHSVLFAVGGGVIGDLAGFVAGTYLRGIRWVGIPTTLLAQVDSSIGGKTGVNHPLGKNMIGVFHQPSLVVCDTKSLQSLSTRDRVSGFGEIAKYGLIFDKAFFAYLEKNREAVLSLSPKETAHAVRKSAEWKAKVVMRDERETLGLRQLLNFGHTLGHALEGATQYRTYRHGEAILWGMRWASALSVERGHLGESAHQRIDALLQSLPVPKLPKHITTKILLPYTKRDKKVKEGRVGFVLLDRIGHAIIDHGVTEKHINAALKRVARA